MPSLGNFALANKAKQSLQSGKPYDWQAISAILVDGKTFTVSPNVRIKRKGIE